MRGGKGCRFKDECEQANLQMTDFRRLEKQHFEAADLILNRDQKETTLAIASNAAFKAEGEGDLQLRRRSVARAASEIENGVWKNPEKCAREIAMHILGDIRHQKLLQEKIALIDAEQAKGATGESSFSHLSKFDMAIVKPMLTHPHLLHELRLEANGRYEVLEPSEQVKLREDFKMGTYLTSAELHRIGLEVATREDEGITAQKAAFLAQNRGNGL